MTEDQIILLLFKVVLIAGMTSIAAFVVQYTLLAPWWRDQLGRTLVIKDILLTLVLVPSVLALFFRFGRASGHIAAWFDIAVFGAITPVMIWRMLVWRKVSRQGRGQ